MYGSHFHAQQSLTFTRPSTQELTKMISIKKEKNVNRKCLFGFLFFIAISLSSLSFAGSSQPKIAGGNGNANGR
jgi:hypothetical protein